MPNAPPEKKAEAKTGTSTKKKKKHKKKNGGGKGEKWNKRVLSLGGLGRVEKDVGPDKVNEERL